MNPADWQDASVLVTGGAGFIGSHLVDALVSRRARVIALDCVDDPWRLRHVTESITYLQADLAAPQQRPALTQPFDAIFHLAAFSSPSASEQHAELAFRQNVIGTSRLLQLARQGGAKRVVFASAGALYTNIPKYLPIDEQHPIDPAQGVYVMTKRIGELLCDDFRRTYGVPCLFVRLFNTYGPRQSEEFLIPSLIARGRAQGKVTLRTETVRRDFSYVSDIVDALLKGAESGYCGGPINLGTGVEHSLGEVAKQIGALLGMPVECLNQPAFGPMQQVCDNALARRALGWQPGTTLAEGLAMTVRSFADAVTEGRVA